METLDDIISVAKSAANAASETGKKIYNISKAKYETIALGGKLSRVYTELGELVYRLAKNDEKDDEKIAELITAADKILEQIAEINLKAEEYKTTITCPLCNFENTANSEYCKNCKSKI